jgi:hypothetical protein
MTHGWLSQRNSTKASKFRSSEQKAVEGSASVSCEKQAPEVTAEVIRSHPNGIFQITRRPTSHMRISQKVVKLLEFPYVLLRSMHYSVTAQNTDNYLLAPGLVFCSESETIPRL